MTDKHADIRDRLKQYVWDSWETQTIRSLLDEVDRLEKLDETNQERITALANQIESERNGYKDLFYEYQKLRKTLEEIAQAEPLSITHDIRYMQYIARKALEGKE